ncbi:MAG: sterol desaturase family protein, partial [Pseudohongiellaceae bacterium]
YWKHRLGHEVALFWGSHVSHHQSEDYNLGTALRQTSIDFHGFLFFLPLLVLGYPAEILFSVVSLNLIYQFWVHTEHIPKLGVLEWVLVTPSNHRVHHARNKLYVDKNYGGVFIIWDRLFGSYQDELESEPAMFGLRKPLNSWNPLWANVHVYWRLVLDFWQAPGLINKLKLPFMPPGWQPNGMRTQCKNAQVPADLSVKFDPQISRFIQLYVLSQFVMTTAVSLLVLLNGNQLSGVILWIAVGSFAFSFYVFGTWLEARTYRHRLEYARLLMMALSCQLLLSNSIWFAISGSWLLFSAVTVMLKGASEKSGEQRQVSA